MRSYLPLCECRCVSRCTHNPTTCASLFLTPCQTRPRGNTNSYSCPQPPRRSTPSPPHPVPTRPPRSRDRGAAIPDYCRDVLNQYGINAMMSYGQTEIGAAVMFTVPGGSLEYMQLLPGVSYELVVDDGADVAAQDDGKTGELVLIGQFSSAKEYLPGSNARPLAPAGLTTRERYCTGDVFEERIMPDGTRLVRTRHARTRTPRRARAHLRFLGRRCCDCRLPVACRGSLAGGRSNVPAARRILCCWATSESHSLDT
jgi:hypothetical protein